MPTPSVKQVAPEYSYADAVLSTQMDQHRRSVLAYREHTAVALREQGKRIRRRDL